MSANQTTSYKQAYVQRASAPARHWPTMACPRHHPPVAATRRTPLPPPSTTTSRLIPQILMDELVQLLPFLRPHHALQLPQPHPAQPLQAPTPPHQVPKVLRRHPRQAPQHLLADRAESRLPSSPCRPSSTFRVEPAIGRVRADEDGALGVGLGPVELELAEEVDGLVGRGGPQDAQLGEGEGEEDELGAQVGVGVGGRAVGGVGPVLDVVLSGGMEGGGRGRRQLVRRKDAELRPAQIYLNVEALFLVKLDQ